MMIGVIKTVKVFNKRIFSGFVITLCMLITSSFMPVMAVSVDSEISVIRTESTKISNIDDWFIGVFTAVESINNSQFVWDWQCVHSSTGSYRLEVTSQNGGSRLRLESGAGDQMNYSIFSYVRRGNRFQLRGHVTSVINLNNLSGSRSLTCADEILAGTNLGFAALVRPADFNPAPPGVYRDVVTLVVSPE